MKTTLKQQNKINSLTKKYGMNEKQSGLEDDGSYFFKTAYGSGYVCIQRDGQITGGQI